MRSKPRASFIGASTVEVEKETGIKLDEALYRDWEGELVHRGLPSRRPNVMHV